MDIYTRVENLEKLVESLIQTINNSKFYTDADVNGVRHSVSEVNQKLDESVFPLWDENGYDYFAGEKCTYNEKYYRCIQSHKSQEDWTPGVAVSLWVNISDPQEEYPEWVQPQGSHDAYNKGDKVSHLDKHWISDIDANVYEPSVYGWSEV